MEIDMRRSGFALTAIAIAIAAAAYAVWSGVEPARAQVARGKYLVQLAGCTDCHTPGHLLGKPDMARFLGRAYTGLTKSDSAAIVEYLRSLPPVINKVPGPLGLDEKATVFRMRILPPDQAGQHNCRDATSFLARSAE
jgi:mono/diheme cytochrome c family protein